MGHGSRKRAKPKHLAAKLRQIRQALKLSQSGMIARLNYPLTCARIYEYETGIREPNLLVLLSYARAANISVENIIDDDLDLFD